MTVVFWCSARTHGCRHMVLVVVMVWVSVMVAVMVVVLVVVWCIGLWVREEHHLVVCMVLIVAADLAPVFVLVYCSGSFGCGCGLGCGSGRGRGCDSFGSGRGCGSGQSCTVPGKSTMLRRRE